MPLLSLFGGLPWGGPELNWNLTNILSHMYDDNAYANAIAAIPPGYEKPWNVRFIPLDTVVTPTLVMQFSYGTVCFAGGTSGPIHVPELLKGWNDPFGGLDPTYGANPAFAKAARQIFSPGNTGPFVNADNVYLVGHSYGGSVMQALALLLRGSDSRLRGIWSYGSPRPGTQVMAQGLGYLKHFRFFKEDDPVRWIPPHTDEASLLDVFGNTPLGVGVNMQVQTPTGLGIASDGTVTAGLGDPGPLHAVSLSVYNWCTNAMGFRSVNHSIGEYRRMFFMQIPLKPQGPAIPASQPLPPTGTLRPREIVAQEEAAIPDINAAVANPTSELNQEVRQLPAPIADLRFKRRRDGRIWVVKYGDDIVDVGPGKRRAGRLARVYNRLVKVTP